MKLTTEGRHHLYVQVHAERLHPTLLSHCMGTATRALMLAHAGTRLHQTLVSHCTGTAMRALMFVHAVREGCNFE